MKSHLLIWVLFIELLVVTGLRAEVDESVRRLEFHLGASDKMPVLYYGIFDVSGKQLVRSADSEPVAFPRSGASALYIYEGPSPLVFYTKTETSNAAGATEVIRTPLARVTIPEGMSRAMFVFFPIEDTTAKRFGVVTVDVSPGAARTGDIRLFNASRHDLAVAAEGQQPEIVPPGQRLDLRGSEVPRSYIGQGQVGSEEGNAIRIDESGNITGEVEWQLVGLRFAVRVRKETGLNEWHRLTFNLLSASPDTMRVVVFYPPKVEGSYYLRRSVFNLKLDGE